MAQQLFTIGHSAMEGEVFLKLLKKFEITLVIDVKKQAAQPKISAV